MAVEPDYSVFTQVELEEILDSLKTELKRTIASYSESGTQVISQRTDDIHKKIAACIRALRKKDPDTYGTDNKTAVSVVPSTFDR